MSLVGKSLKGRELLLSGVRGVCSGLVRHQQAAVAFNHGVEEPLRWEDAKPFNSIPGPSSLAFLADTAWRKFGFGEKLTLVKFHSSLRNQYGNVVRLSSFGKDIVILYEPSLIEKMHRNESNWPVRDGLEYLKYYQEHIRPEIYGKTKGLPLLQGKEWHDVRSTVNPTMMQPRRAKVYTEPIVAIADEFIERMKKIRNDKLELPADYANELNKWSLESIAFVALDTRLGCFSDNFQPDSKAQKMITSVITMFECFFHFEMSPPLWKYMSTPNWKTFVNAMNTITTFAHDCVNEKFKSIQNNINTGNESKSVLEALLASGNPNFAFAMAMDMLVAGVDTTANGAATTLSLLAINPEKQEKLFSELNRLLPNKNSPLTSETLNEMKYLKASIKEAFRMYPVVFGNTRNTVKDMVIGGYQIPKGTKLFSTNQILCNEEKYFKFPEKFIPERWLKSEAKSEISASNAHPFTYLPFGFGPRMCVGRRFAELEMEVVIAKIIRNFLVSYHYGEMEWAQMLFTKPGKPMTFRLEDRPN